MLTDAYHDSSQEETIGWRIYAIWQETRNAIESQQESKEHQILSKIIDFTTGTTYSALREPRKRYFWYLFNPIGGKYGIRTDIA